jgi:3-deoxy-D-manno-octulosonic-acid transferase
MRLIYSALIWLAALPAAWWLTRRARTFDDAAGRWRERFGHGTPPAAPIAVWVHAVSVGEVRAAVPLINALLQQHGDGRVAVTCMTASGSAQVRQLWGTRVHHRYLPFDLPFAVRRFLDRLQPHSVIIIETELWPNLYRALRLRHIPLVIANARLSERSMRGYRRFSGLVRDTLAACHCVAAQSEIDAQRFRQLGAANVQVMGNIKFDVQVPPVQVAAGESLRATLGRQRPVWAAVSTHKGEEEAALAAHQQLLTQHPDAVLILVPRHPQRFTDLWQQLQQSPLRCHRRQQHDYGPETQVLLGDSMGEMFAYLAAADLAFVGGSLVPIGGHNILEPAAIGLPVLFGPHMQNFLAARELLLEARAAIQIDRADLLHRHLQQLIEDRSYRHAMGQRAQATITVNRGALSRLLQMLPATARNSAPPVAAG